MCQDFYVPMVNDGCGNFEILLCEFWPGDDDVWMMNVDWRTRTRRGRLADVSYCEAVHWPDHCFRSSSVWCLSRTGRVSSVPTLICPAIGERVLLD